MNPLKKLAGQTAIYGLPTIVGRLMNYLLVPLYTYNFTRSDYGTMTEMYAYVSFLIIVMTYGMETSLFNFCRHEENKQKVYSTITSSIFTSSLLFITLLTVFRQNIADLIRYPDHTNYIVWFALIIGFDAISAIAFAKLREQDKAKKFAVIKTINIIVNIGFNVFFIGFCTNIFKHPESPYYHFVSSVYNPHIGVGYAFISNLIASSVTLLLLLPEIIKVGIHFDSALWKKMMLYALPLLLSGLAGMTNETLDRILLKYLLPQNVAMAQLGIYGACYKISIIMTMFIQTFRYAAEPFFFSHAKEKNAKELYAQIMKYFIIICAIIFLGTMMNLTWIKYFIGKSFRTGLHVVPILLLANMCLGIFFILSMWYKLTNKTRYGAYLTTFGACITLTLNIYWIPRIGYIGSAWATLICYASMMIASFIFGQKHYKVNYDLKRILAYVALSLTLYLFSNFIHVSSTGLKLLIDNLFLLFFIGLVYVLEKPGLKLNVN